MACTRTTDFGLEVGIKGAKGLTPADADKWGGGTIETIGAGDGYPAIDISAPNEAVERYENMESTGDLSQKKDEIVGEPVNDGLTTHVHSEAIGKLLFPSLGYADLAGPLSDGAGKYAHLFEVRLEGKDQCSYTASEAAKATANVSLSPAYNAGDIVNCDLNILKTYGPADYTIGNMRIQNFKISGAANEGLKVEISGPAESITKDAGKVQSGNLTTTTADFQNISRFFNVTCEVNGVATAIHDFEINANWTLADGRRPTGTSNGGLAIAEPLTGESLVVEGTITIDIHDTDAYADDMKSGVIKNIKIECTEPSGNLVGMYLPAVQYTNAEIDKSEGSKISVPFKAVKPESADPFTDERTFNSTEITLEYADTPFYMVVLNTKTDNYMRLQ